MSMELAALQVYSRAILQAENAQIVNSLSEAINTLVANINQCLQLKEKIETNLTNDCEFEKTLLAAKIGEHNATLDQIPNWDALNNCSKNCCDKEFFMAFMDRISDQVSRVQNKLNKLKNKRKNALIKEINLLEDSYLDNWERIRICKRERNSILDIEHRRLIQNKIFFKNLTFEKPSKRFLDIAHNIGKGDKLSNIKKEDGSNFDNNNDLNVYITDFYANLYRRDPAVEGSIEDFLGQEICDHPLVRNSKLNNNERTALESDLTFEELFSSLNESNLKSAPGIDGFSNLFIKKNFSVLGRPLFNCCKACLNDGSLIETFSTAQIKLIPKKGDTTKLKNWRPISLLSNFYKLLSRAIINRLKSVVNRVLSRAQKGFNKARQIHEVIINLDQSINYCNENQIKGAMVCVDQSKAFDSVDHNYMEKCFKFFGFGERFISWLKTIGTGRKACVLLENGEKSSVFDLLKGTAQGDCPSPIIYNICAQILLFKIELCKEIRKIPIFIPPNAVNRGVESPLKNESFFETGKNESFADNSTTCTYFEDEDLSALKTILDQFSKLSGLRCNFEKTSVMRIGNLDGAIDPRIASLGFQIVDEVKLLGFNIQQNTSLALSNFQILLEKVKKTVNFWSVLNLSLAGKITIAKSLILPLINFYATVLTFDDQSLLQLQNIIENFVVKGTNVSKERIYAKISFGGLNLFKLKDFVVTLQSYWIKRTLLYQHDNWRNSIYFASNVSLLYIQEQDLSSFGHVLAGICRSFISFRNRFGTVGNNFLQVPVLNNPYFFFKENRGKKLLDDNFFVHIGMLPGHKEINTITWRDLINDDLHFRSRMDIVIGTGLI
jgi:Reverse transcriptase (RNA-dependent DNA polymerase)